MISSWASSQLDKSIGLSISSKKNRFSHWIVTVDMMPSAPGVVCVCVCVCCVSVQRRERRRESRHSRGHNEMVQFVVFFSPPKLTWQALNRFGFASGEHTTTSPEAKIISISITWVCIGPKVCPVPALYIYSSNDSNQCFWPVWWSSCSTIYLSYHECQLLLLLQCFVHWHFPADVMVDVILYFRWSSHHFFGGGGYTWLLNASPCFQR